MYSKARVKQEHVACALRLLKQLSQWQHAWTGFPWAFAWPSASRHHSGKWMVVIVKAAGRGLRAGRGQDVRLHAEHARWFLLLAAYGAQAGFRRRA